jgi:hypothetical protein
MSPRTTRGRVKKNDDDGNEDERRLRRKEELDALHQEMELVAHGVTKTGHARRKIPRHQSVQRTQKRKLLEKQDDWTRMDKGDTTNRIRGSMAAAEERVIQGSFIFSNNISSQEGEKEREDDDELGQTSDEEEEGEEYVDVEDGGESYDDGEGDMVDDELEEEALQEVPRKVVASKSSKANSLRDNRPGSKPKRKRLQRLRSFRSSKMAEKHGAALGAHVRGKPGLAIRKLKQVALEAPSAPQIYSSLGMVYEDMLQESQRKGMALEFMDEERVSEEIEGGAKVSKVGRVSFNDEQRVSTDRRGDEMEVQDKLLRNQLDLAKKAYGSYHVAGTYYIISYQPRN